MSHHRTWLLGHDLNRRAWMRSALLGAGIIGLPQWLQRQAQALSAPTKKRSLILLWQDGGPSHFETFDPKPDAPSEYRGELGAIQTTLPGVAYCEVLPRLAQLAHLTCVIRSLHQPSSDHVVGSHNVLTGWIDETEANKSRYPDVGAAISRMRSGTENAAISIGASTDPRLAKGMRGAGRQRPGTNHDRNALPRYIDIGGGLHRGGPAFLGPIDGPFQIAGDPSKPGFVIQNLQSVSDTQRLLSRHQVLESLDRLNDGRQGASAAFDQFAAQDSFRQQAFDLLSGGGASRAFDLSRENPAVRVRYGLHLAGQQCLLARRLVEAGVGVVAARFSPDGRGDYDRTMIGWDDHAVHGNIFEIMRQRGPQFDQSVSALIEDLEQRGMRDDVLVVVVGEFGRTPRIHVHKGCPGREHWGPAGCALLYGGGLAMGQIVGSTNDKGEHPQDRPLTYQSLLATIYHAMGVNLAHTFVNQAGRPVPILPAGEPIKELIVASSRQVGRPTIVRESGLNQRRERTAELPIGSTNRDLAALPDRGLLETLIVHDARIDDEGLAAIADCRNLRCLQLNGASITDVGLARFSQLTSLEELNLTGTRVTAAGLAHLKPLICLNRLSFNGTSIRLADVVRLFVEVQGRLLTEALVAMGLATRDAASNIVSINVAGTEFGDAELQHLGPVSTLRELHLAATRVTDAGMPHIGKLANLERLFLAKCDVSDAGLAHISTLTRLRTINLYGTKLTSAGLEHLSRLEALRQLSITDVKLSPVAVDQLKQKLPRLTVTDYTPV